MNSSNLWMSSVVAGMTVCPRVLSRLILFIFLSNTGSLAFAETPLADAAEEMNYKLVRELILQKANTNAAQPDGMTALHWAVHHDEVSLARDLIAAGADPQSTTRYGVRPLSLSCVNGNEAMIELLLKAGAKVGGVREGGETVLMTAARTGKVESVRLLLEHGAKVNTREKRGQTALMWAAAEGHVEVVDELLSAGANHNIALRSGFNALFFAVREGRAQVVMSLVDAGADVNLVMDIRNSVSKGARRGTAPLILAVENGHFDLAEELLKLKANPNDERSGFTPLHMLSWVRKPNRGDSDDGAPPPRGSGKMSSLQFAKVLVEHGADVNRRLKRGSSGRGRLNRTGATPFLLAADTADVPLMKLLVQLGADPLVPNADHCTPIMAAAGIGTLAPTEEAGTETEALQAVSYILELGGDLNTVDDNGETAMHGAAYKNLPRMVEFLDRRGANPKVWNQANKYGWTPMLIAKGYRPGNFKPSVATMRAIEAVMKRAGESQSPM